MRLQPVDLLSSLCGTPRINLSPDLDLAVIDDVCYCVLDGKDTARPIVLPYQDDRPRSSLRMNFSACHRYISETDNGKIEPYRKPHLRLYYVQIQIERAVPVVIPTSVQVSDYNWIDTKFHPQLQMLAVVGMNIVRSNEGLSCSAKFSCDVVVFYKKASHWIALGDIVFSDYKGNQRN